jgi:hypothetical protein
VKTSDHEGSDRGDDDSGITGLPTMNWMNQPNGVRR